MAFNPKPEYTIVPKEIGIKDFFDYKADFVVRPPYQRKSVWSTYKKQSLMDSLFRRYYIPKLVMREVRLSDEQAISEVIDGQQRITAVQEFFDNKYTLPQSLSDIDKSLPGMYYKDLNQNTNIRKFIDKELKFQVDLIKDIDSPQNSDHQIVATEIFWRLQQGESLNYMEVAHARLSSLTRNFIVKYADDQTFDYEKYESIDENPDKPDFFKLLSVKNDRMKHLQFMARFIMIEQNNGPTDLGDKKIEDFINSAMKDNGIGNLDFEKTPEAKATLQTLGVFYDIFKGDSMLDSKSGIKELSIEYFILSIYLLIRHLGKYYVINEETKKIIHEFFHYIYDRWSLSYHEQSTDHDLIKFSNSRRQTEKELETRDIIIRHIFFSYLKDNKVEIIAKDKKRSFTELERIRIYRDGKSICQKCKEEGKSDDEAKVSWSNYQADHVIPHSLGGETILENSQLLCSYHNQSKGKKI